MKLEYNVSGEKRRTLVGAISMELNAPLNYLGAPSFAYEVGGYTVSKTGTVEGPDSQGLKTALELEHGFTAENSEFNTEAGPRYTEEEFGLGHHRVDPIGENGMQASDVPEPDMQFIEIPNEGFSQSAVDNLRKLVDSKAALIKKALGIGDLEIMETQETLIFPWIAQDISTDAAAVEAYTRFITAMCAMAKEQTRITAKEKQVENEKYAFRCFLLRLGFIGSEYKAARKILLRNLTGNSSFRSEPRMGNDGRYGQQRRAGKTMRILSENNH